MHGVIHRIHMSSTSLDLLRGALVMCLLSLSSLPCTLSAEAGEIRIAVASNFTGPIQSIIPLFEEATGHTVVPVFGSTGKQYAQIVNGAPLDAFFAADVRRPKLLEKEGVAIRGSRFTYAIGRLVLWSPEEGLVESEGLVLETGAFRHLAIANPKLAPYGMAAREVLEARGLWEDLRRRLVLGENISQTYQFVESGNAELGFVALSQLERPGGPPGGSAWKVPQTLHTPIEQQAVLLKATPAATAFIDFFRTDAVRAILESYGYGVPDRGRSSNVE